MNAAGDELLRIDISVVPQMSLADACAILRAAAACPVRLTLLRQRHEPQLEADASTTVVDLEPDQTGGRSSQAEYLVVDGSAPSWISSPEYGEPAVSGQPLRWRSAELVAEPTLDEEFDRRHRSQSFDDFSRDLAPMMVEGVPGAVGVHCTYFDLSAVVPPAQSASSEQWNDQDSLSPSTAFYKTQSSPTIDKMPEFPASTFPTASSTQRLAKSVDELYSYVRQRESREDEDIRQKAARSSLSAVDTVDSIYTEDTASRALDASSQIEGPAGEEFVDDHDFYNNEKTEPALPTPLYAEHNKGVPVDAAESVYVNHSNAQVSATSVNGHRPIRTEVEDADLDGVEKALRAPERSAAGGLAYYINLEDHHFRGFPGQLEEGKVHSADDLRTS